MESFLYLVIFLNFLQFKVLVGPVSGDLLLFFIIKPSQLSMRSLQLFIYQVFQIKLSDQLTDLHEVEERVEVGDSLVAQNQELVVNLLEDGHSLSVDL